MRVLIIILIGSLLGSLFKILGGLIYGSNTLFVDAMTSIANMITLFTISLFTKKTLIPPDSDHHFGHERFEYVGVLFAVVTYSFAAGVAITRLYYIREYTVYPEAVLFAILAIISYGVAVHLSIKRSPALRAYGYFTISEFIEGAVSIIAAFGGAFLHYILDYAGAIFLTTYIFYEIAKEGKNIAGMLVDIAPSEEDYYRVINTLRKENLDVKKLRLRVISKGRLHGDVTIYSDRDVGETIDKVKKKLSSMGVDLCFEIKKEK